MSNMPAGVGPADDEERLVDAAILGDQWAFAALYDRHLGQVYRACFFRTGDRLEAEDLAQQTFLRAWQAIGRYQRTGAPFVAWLLTISHRLAITHHRKARPLLVAELPELPAGDETDPAVQTLRGITHDTVRAAVLRLKPERQHVIVLRFLEGFSVAEIAAVLGKTDNHIRVIQHRALADLRQFLAEPPVEASLDSGVAGAVRTTVSRVAGWLRGTEG